MIGRLGGGYIGLGENLVDVIDQLCEGLGLAVAGLRQLHAEVRADVARIASQHDNAVGQQDGFFNIVRHQEDGLGGHGFVGPELQQFGAQVLGCQDVERAEGLVHEEDLGFHNQRTGKAHALPHSTG